MFPFIKWAFTDSPIFVFAGMFVVFLGIVTAWFFLFMGLLLSGEFFWGSITMLSPMAWFVVESYALYRKDRDDG